MDGGIILRGAIIYFSGTGNTEYVAKRIKEEFKTNFIETALIDVSKKKIFSDEYDFYVFGGPIYAELFPEYFTDWIMNYIGDGRNRKCIVFSTQASGYGSGVPILSKMLKDRGFNLLVSTCIEMPNNYYVVMAKKTDDNKVKLLKENVENISIEIVKAFINNTSMLVKESNLRSLGGKVLHKAFSKWSLGWAKKNLGIDYDLCVKCRKCVKNCPVQNINIGEVITFNNKCISCQKCIHGCPTNAFTYNRKHFKQYKL